MAYVCKNQLAHYYGSDVRYPQELMRETMQEGVEVK